MPSDPSSDRLVDADSVATKTFDTAFRGFDQTEVREYLTAISAALRELRTEQDALLLRLSVAEQRAVPTAELDPGQLTQMLGEETARVLETALSSAQQIRSKSDEHATKALTDANQEAAATRTAADEYASTTTEQADLAATALRTEAEAYSTELRTKAETEATAARTAADAYAADTRQRTDDEAEAARSAADAYALEIRQQADEDRDRKRTDADAYSTEVKERADSEAAAARSEADTYAVGVRQKADADARRVAEEAAADAEQMRADAARVLDERTQEAEVAAAEIRADAEAIRAKASEDAAAEIDRARTRGEKLLAEARGQRDEVTKEIARRRRASRAQLEQVSAARERLLEAYATVRQLADDATEELDRALPEARAAAESVARRAAAEEDEIQAEQATPAEPDTDDQAAVTADAASAEVADEDQRAKPDPRSDARPDLGGDRGGDRGGDPLTGDLEQAEVPPEPSDHDGPTSAAGDPHESDDSDLVAGAESAAPRTAESEMSPKSAKKLRLFGRHKPAEPAPEEHPQPEAPTADVEALFARIRAGDDAIAPDPDQSSELDPQTEPPSDGVASEEEAAEARILGPFGLVDAGPGESAHEPSTASQPSASEPAASEPAASQPAASQPAASEPAAVIDVREAQPATQSSVAVDVVDEVDASRSATLFERRAGLTDAVERQLDRKLKRALSDEQNTVLDSARRARQASFADLVPGVDAHQRQYAEPALDELKAAADAGRRFYDGLVAESGGAAPSGSRPRPDLDALAHALAVELVGPLRERIEVCFVDADGDEFELTDRVRACYREWKAQRLPDAARHYVLSAFAEGMYLAAPKGTSLMWLAETGDPAPCPDCEDNTLAGAVPRGEPFPTGHPHPPAHHGCRCLLGTATAPS